MYYTKFFLFFYIFITILAVICPIRISFLDFLPGLVLMWFYYFIFIFGSRVAGNIKVLNFVPFSSNSRLNTFLAIITISHLIFYPLYINFYTGSSVIEIIVSLQNGISTYALYQSNFENSKLDELTLAKIPFIIGHGILRFLFLVSVFRTIVYSKKVFFSEYFLIFLMTVMIFFVGISRGTSFELFDIITILLFATSTRRILRGYNSIFSFKGFFIVASLLVLALSYFTYNISVRYGDSFDFFEIDDFDKNTIIYEFSSSIALVLYSLYGYFLFGLHFSSIIITKFIFGRPDGMFLSVIPNGIKIFGVEKDFPTYVNRYIDIAAMWRPDSVTIIYDYGLVFAIFILFSLGYISKFLYTKIPINVSSLILLYFIVYFFLSLPVGGFITVSSANKISIIIALVTFRYKIFSRYLTIN